jgi:hypothetical protein
LFRHYFDSEKSKLRKDFSSRSSTLKEKEIKFKSIGKKIQFEFNADIVEDLEYACRLSSDENIKSICCSLWISLKREIY